MNKYLKISSLIIAIIILGLNISYAQEKDTLRFGLIKYKSLEDFKDTYEPFINYIAEECGMIPSYQIVDDRNLGYMLNNNTFDEIKIKDIPFNNIDIVVIGDNELSTMPIVTVTSIVDGFIYDGNVANHKTIAGAIKALLELQHVELVQYMPSSTRVEIIISLIENRDKMSSIVKI